MVAITGAMAHDFNTTDFVSQMEGFQASDNARQKLFAVSHSSRDLAGPHR